MEGKVKRGSTRKKRKSYSWMMNCVWERGLERKNLLMMASECGGESRKKVLLMMKMKVVADDIPLVLKDSSTMERQTRANFFSLCWLCKQKRIGIFTNTKLKYNSWAVIVVLWELQEALFTTAKRLFQWDAIVQRRSSIGKNGEDEVSFVLWYCIGYPQTRAEHNQQAE